jgi:hypothetical protein
VDVNLRNDKEAAGNMESVKPGMRPIIEGPRKVTYELGAHTMLAKTTHQV